jgi:hypothetical protein
MSTQDHNDPPKGPYQRQKIDLFLALKGRIERDLVHYNDPENCKTFSQPARVVGRKEGYEQVLVWIEELLKVDVV